MRGIVIHLPGIFRATARAAFPGRVRLWPRLASGLWARIKPADTVPDLGPDKATEQLASPAHHRRERRRWSATLLFYIAILSGLIT